MIKLKCWELRRWDGGSLYSHKAFIESEIDAKTWKQKNPHDEILEKTFIIYTSLAEYESSKSETTRQTALAKLTDLEKIALGLQ